MKTITSTAADIRSLYNQFMEETDSESEAVALLSEYLNTSEAFVKDILEKAYSTPGNETIYKGSL